jgi:ribonuclease P protein component
VAFAVGRRLGSAVVRNRVRRRLRALASAWARDPGLPAGIYLFIADARAVTASADVLAADFADAVRAVTR